MFVIIGKSTVNLPIRHPLINFLSWPCFVSQDESVLSLHINVNDTDCIEAMPPDNMCLSISFVFSSKFRI